MTYTVIITPGAEAELEHAFLYIHERAPMNAQRWLRRVREQVGTLKEFPERCPIAPDSAYVGEELRHLVFTPYRIIFQIDHQNHQVRIVALRHGAQKFVNQQDEDLPQDDPDDAD